MSSTNGANFTTLDPSTTQSICRIIKASKGANLKAIKYGSLEILFQDVLPKEEILEQQSSSTGQSELTQTDVPGDLISDEEANEALEEIRQENIMIQDPAAYEQMILDNEVFNAREIGEPDARGDEA